MIKSDYKRKLYLHSFLCLAGLHEIKDIKRVLHESRVNGLSYPCGVEGGLLKDARRVSPPLELSKETKEKNLRLGHDYIRKKSTQLKS